MPSEIGRNFTLAAGSNSWPALLAAIDSGAYADMGLQHVEFTFNVISGGPVAHVTKNAAPAAITEGKEYSPGEGNTLRAGDKGCIAGNQQYFYATGADVVYIYARNR